MQRNQPVAGLGLEPFVHLPHHPQNPFTEPTRLTLFNIMANGAGHADGLETHIRHTYPGYQPIPDEVLRREALPRDQAVPRSGAPPNNQYGNDQYGAGEFGLNGNTQLQDEGRSEGYENFMRGIAERREREDEAMRVRKRERVERDAYYDRLEAAQRGGLYGQGLGGYGQQPQAQYQGYGGQTMGYGGQSQYAQNQGYGGQPQSYGGMNPQSQYGQQQENPAVGYYWGNSK